MHVGTTARRHVIALSCSRADVQTCIAGYRSGGLWNAAPRRHRRTSGNRHDRGSGAAARRAGDPPARAGHVSLPHAARAEPSNGSRRCCRPRIYAESDSGNGHAPRCRVAGAIQSGRFDHHEPRPPVSPHRDRAALADLELISTERATAGSRDLPIRAGYQRSRTADRQLSGPVQRRLEPLAASARSGAGEGQGPRAAGIKTRFWSSLVHRTPAESAHTTLNPSARVRARSQPRARNATAQAFAVSASGASTVTERGLPCGALRCDCVRTDPLRSSTTARVRSVLSGSGTPTERRVGRVAGPIHTNWPPRSSSALSTTLASAGVA